MKILNNIKGIILFYLIIASFTFLLIGRTNSLEENTYNKSVVVNLD